VSQSVKVPLGSSGRVDPPTTNHHRYIGFGAGIMTKTGPVTLIH
jgi:hypothetical protein